MNHLALRAISRAEILELESLMSALSSERGHPPGNTDRIAPVKHHFAPGLYAREMFLLAGTRIVGKIHRSAYITTIAKGSGIIWNEFGAFEYNAPMTFVSREGVKNVGWAREDSIIINYHPTNLTDLGELEREIIVDSYEAFDALQQERKGLIL